MQINFDLDEFIAYLLNGGLLLVALNGLLSIDLLTEMSEIFPKDPYAQSIGKALALGALALLSGHVSSVFSRHVVRRLTRFFNLLPRDDPWEEGKGEFWSPRLKAMLKDRFLQVFVDLTYEEAKLAAPRLVRTYVLQRSQSVRDSRERIVRARSLCANAVLPLLVFILVAALSGAWGTATFLAAGVVVLVSKQVDLDQREWKEIYTGFLALDDPRLSLEAISDPVKADVSLV